MKLLSTQEAKDMEWLININGRKIKRLELSTVLDSKEIDQRIHFLNGLRARIENILDEIPSKHSAEAYMTDDKGPGEYFVDEGKNTCYMDMAPNKLIATAHEQADYLLDIIEQTLNKFSSKEPLNSHPFTKKLKDDLVYDKDSQCIHFSGQLNHLATLLVDATVVQFGKDTEEEYRSTIRPLLDYIYIKNKPGNKNLLYPDNKIVRRSLKKKYKNEEIVDMTNMIREFISVHNP